MTSPLPSYIIVHGDIDWSPDLFDGTLKTILASRLLMLNIHVSIKHLGALEEHPHFVESVKGALDLLARHGHRVNLFSNLTLSDLGAAMSSASAIAFVSVDDAAGRHAARKAILYGTHPILFGTSEGTLNLMRETVEVLDVNPKSIPKSAQKFAKLIKDIMYSPQNLEKASYLEPSPAPISHPTQPITTGA